MEQGGHFGGSQGSCPKGLYMSMYKVVVGQFGAFRITIFLSCKEVKAEFALGGKAYVNGNGSRELSVHLIPVLGLQLLVLTTRG